MGEMKVVLPRAFFTVLLDGVLWDKTKINFEFRWDADNLAFSVVVEGERHGFVISREKKHGKIRILPLNSGDFSFHAKSWEEAAAGVKNVIQAKRAGHLMATGEKVPISVLCRKEGIRRCAECDDMTCERNKVVQKARQP
jgi:hypothetical protein